MKQPMSAGLLQGWGETGQQLAQGLPYDTARGVRTVLSPCQDDLVLFLPLLPELV